MLFLFELELFYEPLVVLFCLGLSGFAGAFFRWYLAIPALLLSGFLSMILLFGSDFYEPDVYPVLLWQDPYYLPITYAAIFASVAMPILGGIRDLRRLWRNNTKL